MAGAILLALLFKVTVRPVIHLDGQGTYPLELIIIYERNCTGRASAYPYGYPDGPLGYETHPLAREIWTVRAFGGNSNACSSTRARP